MTTTMMSWDPFEDLRRTQDEMLRMTRARAGRFSELDQPYDRGTSAPGWAPPVDISERKDAYLVTVELPGVAIDDLEITFEDGLMTIQGQRPAVHDSSEEKVHRAERRYGLFRRSITLPRHVIDDEIEASTRDGVLQILVPKAQEVHPKRIQVRVGEEQAVPIPAADSETTTTNPASAVSSNVG